MALDTNDPFPVCFIDRKITNGEAVFFHKGHPEGSSPGFKVESFGRARGRYVSGEERPEVSGFYSMLHGRGGETFSTGECGRLKFKQKPDGLHVYALPYA